MVFWASYSFCGLPFWVFMLQESSFQFFYQDYRPSHRFKDKHVTENFKVIITDGKTVKTKVSLY